MSHLKIRRVVTTLTPSLERAFRPVLSVFAPSDCRPVEMAAPQLAADLVPQVYRRGQRPLMVTDRVQLDHEPGPTLLTARIRNRWDERGLR